MSHPLDGCIAKLDRADVQIRTLAKMVKAFIDSEPYTMSIDRDAETWEWVLYGHVRREPPTIEWGALIGEVLHDLRSALDNLVWELTVSEQTRLGKTPPADPIPKSRTDPAARWRSVSFPIVLVSTAWPPQEAQRLWGVRPSARAILKALQPFSRPESAPDREPLAILDELWNIDKHRHAHLTQSYTGLEEIRSNLREQLSPEIELPDWFDVGIQILSKRDAGPFEDGAELARYIQSGPTIVALGEMHVDARLAFDVAFGQGPPAHGAGLIQMLDALSQTARSIVAQFKSELP